MLAGVVERADGARVGAEEFDGGVERGGEGFVGVARGDEHRREFEQGGEFVVALALLERAVADLGGERCEQRGETLDLGLPDA